MKPINLIPVFALGPESDWNDLENAMEASVEHQNRRGKILPLLLFAPMTEPQNPDTWEPLKLLPENLLMISIERHIDRRVVRALERARATRGNLHYSGAFPILVHIDFRRPLAEVFDKMARANIQAFAHVKEDKDDASFFFLRGGTAVKTFAEELPKATNRR